MLSYVVLYKAFGLRKCAICKKKYTLKALEKKIAAQLNLMASFYCNLFPWINPLSFKKSRTINLNIGQI